MADQRNILGGLPAGLVPMQVQRPPTDAERAEVEKVRSMQVRKDAVTLVVQAGLGTTDATGVALVEAARLVATFIEDG